MKCLNCDKEFSPKRSTAKYCSDNCRVKSFLERGKKEKPITVTKLQVLYNSLLDMVGKINTAPLPTTYDAPKYKPIFDEPLPYDKPKIRRTKEYFESIILKGGCHEPEDHRIFIQEVNESDLHPKIKSDLITASRTIQS